MDIFLIDYFGGEVIGCPWFCIQQTKGSCKKKYFLFCLMAVVKTVPLRKKKLFLNLFFSDGEVPTAIKLEGGLRP